MDDAMPHGRVWHLASCVLALERRARGAPALWCRCCRLPVPLVLPGTVLCGATRRGEENAGLLLFLSCLFSDRGIVLRNRSSWAFGYHMNHLEAPRCKLIKNGG